jgi:hypothetical protein
MRCQSHNPDATIASRGCPGMGTEEAPKPCSFCIVPVMEGTKFKLLPDFPVRPILCDNNLSALPADYQDYIIRRYQEAGVKLKDANSGFEPVTFTPEVYARWRPLVNAGGGPWRFGYDTKKEAPQARARDEDAGRRASEAEAPLRPDRQRALRRLHGAHPRVHRGWLRAARPAGNQAQRAQREALLGALRLDVSEARRRGAMGRTDGFGDRHRSASTTGTARMREPENTTTQQQGLFV